MKPIKRNESAVLLQQMCWQRSGQTESPSSLWRSGDIEGWSSTVSLLLRKNRQTHSEYFEPRLPSTSMTVNQGCKHSSRIGEYSCPLCVMQLMINQTVYSNGCWIVQSYRPRKEVQRGSERKELPGVFVQLDTFFPQQRCIFSSSQLPLLQLPPD